MELRALIDRYKDKFENFEHLGKELSGRKPDAVATSPDHLITSAA